jgi:C4-dicarboxylate-binding protein DctP
MAVFFGYYYGILFHDMEHKKERHMKKFAAVMLGILILAGGAFAQGSGSKVYKIKLGHASSTESTRHKALLVFKDFVEKKSNGRFVVELYPGAMLGNEGEMIESLKMGTQEAFTGGVFDSQTPKLNLILMPFFFPTQADLMKIARSDIGKMIMKDAEKYGIKMLAFGDGGSRHFTNNLRPIRSPADMKGLKIRTPPIESIIKCMQALGANPVSIPYGETYMALKTGVADGQENPLANIGDMKFFEVQKYMTLIDYQFHPEPFDVNLAWFNALPADLQGILEEGAWIYTDKQNELRRNLNEHYYKMITAGGVQVYQPTAAERDQFIKACDPVYDYFVKKGLFTQADLDTMRKIIASK